MTRSVWARLLLLAWLWGSEFLLVKIALRGIGPPELVVVRLGLAAILLFSITLVRGERLPKDGPLYFHCIVLGLACTALPYLLMGWAEQTVSSALTGILVGSGPLLTAALAALFLPAERLNIARVSGLVVGLIGVVLVIDPTRANLEGDFLGCLAALGVALGFAVAYVYNVRFLTKRSASGPMIMSIQSFAGAVFVGLWLASRGQFRFQTGSETVAAVVTLGLVNTGLAAIVFFSLLRSAGAVATSLVEYLMVIVAIVLGLAFLNESISLVTTTGVILVLGGISLTERNHKRSNDGSASSN